MFFADSFMWVSLFILTSVFVFVNSFFKVFSVDFRNLHHRDFGLLPDVNPPLQATRRVYDDLILFASPFFEFFIFYFCPRTLLFTAQWYNQFCRVNVTRWESHLLPLIRILPRAMFLTALQTGIRIHRGLTGPVVLQYGMLIADE